MSDDILLMPFLDESPSFCHGWQCGQMWERLSRGEAIDYVPIHEANIEQMAKICEYHGYHFEITGVNKGWAFLTANPVDISDITI